MVYGYKCEKKEKIIEIYLNDLASLCRWILRHDQMQQSFFFYTYKL